MGCSDGVWLLVPPRVLSDCMNEGGGEILDYFSKLHQLVRGYSVICSGGVVRTNADTP